MRVKKRDGTYQQVDFTKISLRIKYMASGIDPSGVKIGDRLKIDPIEIAKDVCGLISDGISSTQLDDFSAELCAYKVGDDLEYDILASRLVISNHHKNTQKYEKFSEMVRLLYDNVDSHGNHSPLLSHEFYKVVINNADILDEVVSRNHNRDYESLDYFGFKTLERAYLLKVKHVTPMIQERYQHLLMRVALAIYLDDIPNAVNCYEMLSQSLFTHATPTLFNSGTPNQQLSSCFLLGMDDSIEGMYECLRRAAHISKWSGGLGIWASDIRGNGSQIRGTNGQSNGLIPLMKVANEEFKHVDQGGKRKGSAVFYIEPWHKDVMAFLDVRKNHGAEDLKTRDLFTALWVPDIFMTRVKKALTIKRLTGTHNIVWSLMCPFTCKGLTNCYGSQFDELYCKYEQDGKYSEQMDILKLWQAILDSQKETGTPYICYKDHVNSKNNQKNLGVIKSSNLCTEIMEYSDHEEYAVCNLASINLRKMVKFTKNMDGNNIPHFDMKLLHSVTKQVVRNLDRIIDINYYPVPQTKKSNFKNRPVGLGVQGLADAFILMGFPFESEQAQLLNKQIFETMYHASVEASSELAKERFDKLSKVPVTILHDLKKMSSYIDFYENFFEKEKLDNKQKFTLAESEMKTHYSGHHASLIAQIRSIIDKYELPKNIGEYQYMNLEDLKYIGAYSTFCGSPTSFGILQYDMWGVKPSGMWDFDTLKENINDHGIRNSLLMAVMPTATTAQILGSIECIEPMNSVIYSRSVLAGTFIVVNKDLQKILTEMGLWNRSLKDRILMNRGSIQKIPEIPKDIKLLFKTGWEMSKKTLINMSADRGAWIDQSQSFNYFIEDPDNAILTSCHIHGWEKGLKTGMYYLRRKTIVDPQQFSVDISKYKDHVKKSLEKPQELVDTNTIEGCVSCGT
jgi:ribonucleotide reductase alpha subunit